MSSHTKSSAAAGKSLADRIERLRREVRAFDAEFDLAQHLHAVWEPMADDRQLQERVHKAGGGRTFSIIRFALRREMILALMRIWDRPAGALRIEQIIRDLMKPDMLDELARRRAQQHDGASVDAEAFSDIPEADQPLIHQAAVESERRFGSQRAAQLREDAERLRDLVGSYKSGANKPRLEWLSNLRNQNLAHRQLIPDYQMPDPQQADQDITAFYKDTLVALRELSDIVLDVSYDPDNTARIRRAEAESFWNGVHCMPRGDRAERLSILPSSIARPGPSP